MIRHWPGFLALVLLAGCQTTVIPLDATFPPPLIDKFPIAIGVYYTPEFAHYKHEEDIPPAGKVTVEAGLINVHLFDRLLPGLFAEVRHLTSVTGDATMRGVLVPEIAEMQFSLPEQSHNELYEVWLKYKIKLQTSDGKPIAEWPITAYGKYPTGVLVFRGGGLNKAAAVALRDAAASFTLSLRDVADVQRWLEAESTAAESTAGKPGSAP